MSSSRQDAPPEQHRDPIRVDPEGVPAAVAVPESCSAAASAAGPSDNALSGRADEDRSRRRGLRAVAVFVGFKGAIVLIAGFGLLGLVHHRAQRFAEEVVRTLHLDPARRIPRIFLDAASRADDRHLRLLAGLALAYSCLRFIEAFGLWRMRPWAEWFGIVTGGVYIPAEIWEIVKRPTLVRVLALVLNVGIVAYLARVRALDLRARARRDRRRSPP